MRIGCPTCGTILNATAAGGCKDHWHEENKTSVERLEDFMRLEFPRAVAQADGDAILAAMSLMNAAAEVVRAYWPIVSAQVTSLVGHLESMGIDLGPKRG